MKLSRKHFRVLGVASVAGAMSLTMVTASGASSGGLAAGAKVNIGISLSLSGDFSADGLAFQQGYKLWASDVNKTGGLLGHQVNLVIKSDASSPTQVVTNYQALISSDHVNLTFGPFSSLLTLRPPRPSRATATRWSRVPVVRHRCSKPGSTTCSTLPCRSPTRWCRSPTGCRRCPQPRVPSRWPTSHRTTLHPAADPRRSSDHVQGWYQDRVQPRVPCRGDRLHADR